MVCSSCFEHRHPQELIRPVQDQHKLPWTQPEGTDISVGDLSPLYLVASIPVPDTNNTQVATSDTTVILPLSGVIIVESGAVISRLTITSPPPSSVIPRPTTIRIIVRGILIGIINSTDISIEVIVVPPGVYGLTFGDVVQPTDTFVNDTITPAVSFGTGYYTGTATIALGNNPTGATLGGTLTQTATDGRVTFNNLSINKYGRSYTLVVTANDNIDTVTDETIAFDTKVQLAFIVQPSEVQRTVSISPAIEIAAWDVNNTIDTSYTGNITVALEANPGPSTLSGTLTQAAVAGVATFSDLSLDVVADGYTLRAEGV